MTIEVPPAATEAAAESKVSRWGARLNGIFFSPVATLRSIAAKPDILLPLLFILATVTASYSVIVPKVDFDSVYREAMEASGRSLPPADMDRMIKVLSAFGKATMYARGLFAVGWYALVAGAVLLAVRLFGGEGSYKQAYSITLYSSFPLLLKAIILSVVVRTRSSVSAMEVETIVRSNPAFLFNPMEKPVPFALLASLDVFMIWTLVLATIGFAFMATKSRAFSAGVVISLWLLGVLASTGAAVIGASRMKG